MSNVGALQPNVDLLTDPQEVKRGNEKAKGGGDKKSTSFDFSSCIEPFIVALGSLKRKINFIGTVLYECLHAIYIVFHRLIIPPKFNPESAKFAKDLELLKENLPNLQARFLELSTRGFTSDYLMFRDLDELYQLNKTIQEQHQLLKDFARAADRMVHQGNLQDKVKEVKNGYAALDNDCFEYYEAKRAPIIDNYIDMVLMFTEKDVTIQQDIYRDFVKLYNKIKTVFGAEKEKQKLTMAEMKLGLMCQLTESNRGTETKPSKPHEPVKLVNIGATSCWLDSTVQAVLCSDLMVQNLRQPVDRNDKEFKNNEEKYKKVLTLQKEILKLTEPLRGGAKDNLTLTEFILLLTRGGEGRSSIKAIHLREAIFAGLGIDEYDAPFKNRQRDAAPLMELIIDQFLPCCKFKMQNHKTAKEFDGLDFVGPVAEMKTLPLAIPEENKTLEELIDLDFNEICEANGFRFNPAEGIPIKPGAPNPHLNKDPIQSDYQCNQRLIDLPQVLVLQLKRFNTVVDNKGKVRMVKINHAVKLPENGVIDLTKHCDASKGKPEKALYRIKSYVQHSGGYGGGHYVGYVEKEGKYYECNDLNFKGEGFAELVPPTKSPLTSRAMFLRNTNPYLIVTERLTPEEVDQFEAEEKIRAEEEAKKAELRKARAAAQAKKNNAKETARAA